MNSFFFFSSELIVNRILIFSIVVNEIFSLFRKHGRDQEFLRGPRISLVCYTAVFSVVTQRSSPLS